MTVDGGGPRGAGGGGYKLKDKNERAVGNKTRQK